MGRISDVTLAVGTLGVRGTSDGSTSASTSLKTSGEGTPGKEGDPA